MPKFNIESKLEHNGKCYESGGDIDLSAKFAAPLLELNVISIKDKSDAEPTFTTEQIVNAIIKLDKDNKDLFTGDGLPTTKAIENELGGNISADERDAAWIIFNQE